MELEKKMEKIEQKLDKIIEVTNDTKLQISLMKQDFENHKKLKEEIEHEFEKKYEELKKESNETKKKVETIESWFKVTMFLFGFSASVVTLLKLFGVI